MITIGVIAAIVIAILLACHARNYKKLHATLRELRRSEEEYRTRYHLLTNNVAAAVVIHEENGTIDWCSPYTEVLTGYARSELLHGEQLFLLEHVHEEDKNLIRKALAIVSTGEPFQCRFRLYHRSGLLLWLEMRTVPIFDQDSGGFAALSLLFDVTHTVNNQLLIEERSRDLHEFTYMLSHDLKAPIFTIKGMLGLLEEEHLCQETPALQEPLDYIHRATKRLEQLVSGVLELAKVSATETSAEPVNLAIIGKMIEEDYGKTIRDGGGVFTIDPELPTVLGNESLLYRIIGNLVGNAVKYQVPDRSLTLAITLEKNPSPRRCLIAVRDNGMGISAESLPLLFKPFQRIARDGATATSESTVAVEGTGIGLACVFRLTEKIGGSIRAESAEGTGTTFFLELRRAGNSFVP